MDDKPKDGRTGRSGDQANRREIWDRAESLGIDTAGMSWASVQKAVQIAEAALEKSGKVKAPAKAPEAPGGDSGPQDRAPEGKPASDKPADLAVELENHVKASLLKIADFLEVEIEEGAKKGEIIATIKASGRWPEDPEAQAQIVSAVE